MFFRSGKDAVDLSDKNIHFRDKFDKPFRDQDYSIVVSSFCTLCDGVYQPFDKLSKSLLFLLYLLSNKGMVGPCE